MKYAMLNMKLKLQQMSIFYNTVDLH